MSIKRQPMKADQPEDVRGKYKDTMKGMFDTKGKESENFHSDLMRSLDENKKKYDRQLYSDWVIKVYQRCTDHCVKAPLAGDDRAAQLKEIEKQCARNCMRKHDRAYKTFDQVEKRIFDEFITDEKIDPRDFMKALAKHEEQRSSRDMEAGAKLIEQGNL